MSIEILSKSEAATLAVGQRLASLLHAGDVILLSGALGSGKTVFATGVAEGLGVEERVVSPTFILARTYAGLLELTHADVYRLSSHAEVEDLDLIEQARGGVLIVEWGQAIRRLVPPDHLLIELEVSGELERKIRFLPMGAWTKRPLEELAS